MSEEPRTTVVEIEQDSVLSLSQEEVRRAQLFHVISLVTVGGATMVLLFFLVTGALSPQPSFRYVIPVTVVYFLVTILDFWLGRRRHLDVAIAVYMANTIVGMFVSIYFFNGVTGPVVIVLVVIPVVAGLLGGRRLAYWTAVNIGVLYLAMALLETLDVLQPWEVTGLILRLVYGGLFFATLVIAAIIAAASFALTQRALSIAQQHSQELAKATRQAERAAQAEREAREREERAARQLRQAVQEYTAFLERVAAGDYRAMLTLDEVDEGEEGVRELRILGDYLNATVESLVTALSGMQILQQRYLRDAWESFAQTGAVHRGFRYHDPSTPRHTRDDADSGQGPSTLRQAQDVAGPGRGARVEPDDEAWLTPMAKAVQDKDVTVSEQEVALPITLRGQIIGAIGARREERIGWSEEDVALAQMITDQLAQTIENLRLLDETQRRAARERLTANIATRVRASTDVETILRTSIRELGRALRASDGLIRVGTGGGVGSLQADKGVGDNDDAST